MTGDQACQLQLSPEPLFDQSHMHFFFVGDNPGTDVSEPLRVGLKYDRNIHRKFGSIKINDDIGDLTDMHSAEYDR